MYSQYGTEPTNVYSQYGSEQTKMYSQYGSEPTKMCSKCGTKPSMYSQYGTEQTKRCSPYGAEPTKRCSQCGTELAKMNSLYGTDPILSAPSNYVDFFDDFKPYDLDYDIEEESSSVLPPDILDQDVESVDDGFLCSYLPGIPESPESQYDSRHTDPSVLNTSDYQHADPSVLNTPKPDCFQDQLYPSYQNSNNFKDGDPDLSLNGQFTNSCSLYSAEDPLRPPSNFSGVDSYSTDPLHFANSFSSNGVYSPQMNSNSPLTLGAEASNHYNRRCESSENSRGSSDSPSLENSSDYSGEPSRRPRQALADLTDAEKYLRVRGQNNVASREYRNRKKSKMTLKEIELQRAEEQNLALKLSEKKLQAYLQNCEKAKEIFEKLGCNFSNMDLS